MPSVRPAHDDAYWATLAEREWRRIRWRRGDGPDADATCVAFGLPLHRIGTYYVRPAYTDGAVWLSQQGYDEMVRRTTGRTPTRRSRPGATPG